MTITYQKYETKFRERVISLLEELQDHIISLDTFGRVKREASLGEHNFNKVLKKIENSEGQMFLAIEEEKIVGLIVAIILDRNEEYDMQVRPGKYGEIEKLYILEEFRGMGIGKELLRMAEEYLVDDQNCDFIEIVVFGDNKDALEIYKKKGYREREFVLLKKVV